MVSHQRTCVFSTDTSKDSVDQQQQQKQSQQTTTAAKRPSLEITPVNRAGPMNPNFAQQGWFSAVLPILFC